LTADRYHLENPYWKTFDPYVIPLLEGDMDLRRYNEIDASHEVRVDQDPALWEGKMISDSSGDALEYALILCYSGEEAPDLLMAVNISQFGWIGRKTAVLNKK
jgi:hypothetical protein